jgi:hypothetical protein
MIKEIIRKIFKLLIQLLTFNNEVKINKLINNLIIHANDISSKSYYTYHKRSTCASDIHFESILDINCIDYSEYSIIIQGPIIDFIKLKETIQTYFKFYTGIHVVLSTWKDDATEKYSNEFGLLKIKNPNFHIVLNEKPEKSGSHNINFQIKSTKSGLMFSKQLGVKYALKTRTDMRIYNPLSLLILTKLYKENKQKIIEITSTVCKFRLWSMSDLFQFAELHKLDNFWDVELDNRHRSASEYASKKYRTIDIISENVAEIYLHRKYAEKINFKNDIDVNSYRDFIVDNFYLIDKSLIDLVWFKYAPLENNWVSDPGYGENQLLSRLHQAEFLLLLDFKLNESITKKMLNEFEN